MNFKVTAVTTATKQLEYDIRESVAKFYKKKLHPSGNKIVDLQHLWIVKYLCMLRYFILDVKTFEPKLHSILKDIKDYVDTHFKFEQRLSDLFGYLSLYDAKEERTDFTINFNKVEQAIKAKTLHEQDVEYFIAQVEHWISAHSLRIQKQFSTDFAKNTTRVNNLILQMTKQRELNVTKQEYELYLYVIGTLKK